MAKIGDAVSLTVNGTKFAIPKDVEPIVVKGGEVISETQGYGDGTADAYHSIIVPKITGLKCKISDDNRDAWESACKQDSIPIVLECVSKSYELTGCIVGEIGVSSTKATTDEFEVHAQDGGGIRES